MRILVLGAGGTGGYFGGRLAQSGADVTFLVRAPRAQQLDRDGLQLRSPLGDANIPVAHVTADALPALCASQPFDLVLLSCKAYDLDTAMAAIAPAMHAGATVMPILNGLRHYPLLDAAFGRDHVLGGLCVISAMKGPHGEILHLGTLASMTFGERDGAPDSPRTLALARACERAGIDHTLSAQINQALWAKFVFLTTLAAATCLMRASVGDIVATDDGLDFMQGLYRECAAVAEAAGEPIAAEAQRTAIGLLTQSGSTLTASMLRDLQAGQPVEAEHIVGDMLRRAREAGVAAARLVTAWCHLQAYGGELARRASEHLAGH